MSVFVLSINVITDRNILVREDTETMARLEKFTELLLDGDETRLLWVNTHHSLRLKMLCL